MQRKRGKQQNGKARDLFKKISYPYGTPKRLVSDLHENFLHIKEKSWLENFDKKFKIL